MKTANKGGNKNEKAKRKRRRQITRREFVGGALATAGVVTAAPAFLRGQNLNSKLDIAFIAAGGRANANMSELTVTEGSGDRDVSAESGGAASGRERRRPLRRRSGCSGHRVTAVPKGQDVQGPPTRL